MYIRNHCVKNVVQPRRAFEQRFKSETNVRCVLSCDKDHACQQYIRQLGETEILFGDVSEVAAGKGINILTGKKVILQEECDVLAAGTSCVNFSSMKLGFVYRCCFRSSFPRSSKYEAARICK